MTWLETLPREFAHVFPGIFAIEAGRYVVTAGLVSLLTWALWRSWFQARKIQTRTAEAGDYRREVRASLLTAVIFALTGFGMYLASKAGWLTIYPDFQARGPIYFGVTLVAMVLAHDAYFYWTHRAMHHPRLFRTFHWTHHKSKTPTPWSAYAFDTPEALLTVAFVPLWTALVPMHDLGLYVFVTWQIVRNVMGHAGVELSPASGRPSHLMGWLNTTTHHDLHHQQGRSNYGLYFTWWDRLMGTEHPEYQARVAEVVARSRQAALPVPRAVKVAVVVGLAVIGAGVAVAARAQPAGDVSGRWATEGLGSIVELLPCAGTHNTLCGRIVWLWQGPRADTQNPDPALRNRSLKGVAIIRGLRQAGPGVWSGGALYNPDDGRTYTGDVRLRGGVLELRGCALKVVCKTQTWRRTQDVIAALQNAGV